MKKAMLAVGFVLAMAAWGFMHSPYWHNWHVKSMQWDIADIDADIDRWNDPYTANSIPEMRAVLVPRQHYLTEASARLNKMEMTLSTSKMSAPCESTFRAYIVAGRQLVTVESKLIELLNEPPNRESLEKLKPEEDVASAALNDAINRINITNIMACENR